MFARQIGEVLAVHLRFARGGGDLAAVPREDPAQVTSLEERVDARARLAVRHPGLEPEDVVRVPLRRGDARKVDEAELGVPRGEREVRAPFEDIAQLTHVAWPVVG